MTFDSDGDVGIRLDNAEACQQELERCSNKTAELTQEYTRNGEQLGEHKRYLEEIKSIVAKTIRETSDAKLTATEVNAKVTEMILEDENFAHAWEVQHELEAERDVLERRLRTLEKRGGFAQTAMNKHLKEDGFGG